MKTVRKDSVTGYKLDFATNTLTVNYKFNKGRIVTAITFVLLSQDLMLNGIMFKE